MILLVKKSHAKKKKKSHAIYFEKFLQLLETQVFIQNNKMEQNKMG